MSLYDLIVRGGTLVTGEGLLQADLAVADGRIVAVAPELAGTSKEEIDARGWHVFPGVIDAHVHFNEPGRTHWEGFASGTRALAAGGTTAYFEMPLNAHPPTIDAAAFDAKLAAARASSLVDFGLWGGLVPGNIEHMEELAERGVIGYKAFMSNSGIDDFSACDDLTLYEGMRQAAKLGRIVAVHAENDQITSNLARRAREEGRTGWRDYLASRPVIAELEAIERAILFAAETGCSLHIVHVSSGRGVSLVAEARARGIDVSCETCPHYLVLAEDDLERLGAVAKCAPPLRSREEQEALWQQVFAGNVPMIASDHSPAPPEMKTGANAFRVWGGISGCQSLLQLLLTEGHYARHLPLNVIATLTAGYVARRFLQYPQTDRSKNDLPVPLPVSPDTGEYIRSIPNRSSDFAAGTSKGRLAVGYDADLALVDLQGRSTLQAEDLFYRYRHSPYVGRELRGRVIRTLVRGQTVYSEGEFASAAVGQLLRPSVHSGT